MKSSRSSRVASNASSSSAPITSPKAITFQAARRRSGKGVEERMRYVRLLAVVLLAVAFTGTTLQVGHAQAAAARTVVDDAAKALGGAEKIRSVRNIILHGYAQYAYQMGGGRISGSLDAPEKYMAANDLTRVYDLANGRFQMRERRNMLFPFLAPF